MKIVAIGGGEIGRPGTKVETRSIDKEAVKLTGKSNPKLLFIPTASGDSDLYGQVVNRYFGNKYKCKVSVIRLIKERPSKKEIEKLILGADIIYVGGGNTLRMVKLWRKLGVDKLLKKAMQRGTVLSGVSAGAICWFKYGNSDSLKFKDKRNPLIKLKCLDFIPLMTCPHYDVERDRRPSLLKMIKERGGMAIALDNRVAFECVDNQYRILRDSPKAHAYRVYKAGGKVIEEKLPTDMKWRAIKDLLVR